MMDPEQVIRACPGCLKPLLGRAVSQKRWPKMKRRDHVRFAEHATIERREYCGRTCRMADRRAFQKRIGQ